MRVVALIALALLIAFGGCVATPAQEDPKAAATAPQQQAAEPSADKSRIVYVSDFELDVPNSAEKGVAEKSVPSSAQATAAQSDAKKEDGPTEQANKLVEFMSTTLVKELQKAGYTAQRMRPNDARPDEGIQVKGVFTEPDAENHLRRAVIGSGPSVGKMTLFVGIGNLARPDQALYAVVDLKNIENSENKPGAIITVSAYAPVAKFEMPKNVTEKAVKDTAAAIVADLTLLLNTNIASGTH
jgi:hypothetical protein